MSPIGTSAPITVVSGPRASGDEPTPETVDVATGEWSPRERG